jgi:DNA replication protein DnaC
MIELSIPDVPLADTGDVRERQRYIDGNRLKAAETLAKHVPVRFADATITVPEVGAWAQELINTAMHRPRHDFHGGGIACDCGPTLRPWISRGPSLLLLGPTGVGKSHTVYGAIRQLAQTGLLTNWKFCTAPDLYGGLRPRFGVDAEHQFQEILSASLLVVDDLGAARSTEWVEEINYRLVNTRYEQQKPTIYVSNLTNPQLREVLPERVASRLADCRRIAMKGPDRRRAA